MEPGDTVFMRVFVGEDVPFIDMAGIQPFVMSGNYWAPLWYDTWYTVTTRGHWATLQVEIPEDAQLPILRLGLQLKVLQPTQGTFWIDSIDVVRP